MTPETAGAGRREALSTAAERPAVVWSRSAELTKTDAAPAAATQAQLGSPAGQTTTASLAPASRRQRPAARPIVAVQDAPAAPPSAPTADGPAPAAPLTSRRARRAQTGQFGAVGAPAGEPAAASKPPFELLEPLVDGETAPIPTPTSSTVRAGAASGSASTWMAGSFAKILAAEAVAAAATTAPLVEATAAAAPEPVVSEPAQAAASIPVAEAGGSAEPRPTAPDARPATEQIHPLTGPIPQAAASDVDEFEAAARLFEFTGETPVQQPSAETAQAGDAETAEARPAADDRPTAHAAPRRSKAGRGASFRRVATASFSGSVLGIVGLMAVGMTTPAEAVAAVRGVDASLSVVAPGDQSVPVIDEAEIQAYVAPAGIEHDTLDRPENYTTTTTAQLASEAGIKNFSNLFRNDPNSNIQWPFTVGVTMSYGFGMRSGRMHEGVDFTPGAGAPIQAIADGTVRVASEAGGAYGVHVIIDHVVDGQLISSHYAHMEYGSLQVSPGQHVTVGTVLGRTGNTGRSYGAHTHFELLQNGTTAIDPMPWLREHTDGTHTVG
ncbi:M23 family metallopeptidase [Microbacterium atlanticum]|uniref:M23 family metallopeptidase n=1 Tax=Microbacterium atlanticum TaxID=2782168 RepID=UPI001E477280|nr:M23 family metallopeptidase [Microbacterium atlanticum]